MVTNLMLTRGAFPVNSVNEPFMVVGFAGGKPSTNNLRAYAEAVVKKTAMVTQVTVREGRPVGVDGINGYELIATAKDKPSGKPVTLYQTLLFDGQRIFTLLGQCAADQETRYLNSFRQITQSFKRKK